jgi:hypothetical protein
VKIFPAKMPQYKTEALTIKYGNDSSMNSGTFFSIVIVIIVVISAISQENKNTFAAKE